MAVEKCLIVEYKESKSILRLLGKETPRKPVTAREVIITNHVTLS